MTIFDNFSRKGVEINLAFLEQEFQGTFTLARGDVRSMSDLDTVMAKDPCDVVLHLAGQVAVTTSVIEPREDFEINALGTFNVLEAVRKQSSPPIVLFSSTNKVYGGLDDLSVEEQDQCYVFANGIQGVTEQQQLDFHSPYGCSKGAADQYVRDYARIYGLKTVVFRQSCIYGPHQMGVEDQGWVAWFLIAAMFKRPFSIYGNGKQVRDLLWIDDLVDAYDRAIDRIDQVAGRVYNVGGGPTNTLSLLEFLQMLQGEFQLPLTYDFSGTRPGDQPIFVSNNTAAKQDLGWEPTMSVADGIRQLHGWLKTHESQLQQLYQRT